MSYKTNEAVAVAQNKRDLWAGFDKYDYSYARIAENNFGCDDPNDPITRAQIESAYFGDQSS